MKEELRKQNEHAYDLAEALTFLAELAGSEDEDRAITMSMEGAAGLHVILLCLAEKAHEAAMSKFIHINWMNLQKEAPAMSDDFIQEVLRLRRDDGLLADTPIAGGNLHRCPIDGKERARDGSCVIHIDKTRSAWWKNWKSGIERSHCEKTQEKMTPKQRKAYAAFVKKQRKNP